MKRTNLNFIIDSAAFGGFVVLTTTGVLMRYILPPGSGHRTTIWGWDRHDWGGVHFWISVGFFLILALHALLHWRWVASVVSGRPREGSGLRAGLGMVGLATLIAFSVSPLLTEVEVNSSRQGSSVLSSHAYEDIQLRGSMTLKEVADSNGVPAAYLIGALKLPGSVPETQQLGRLKRSYGIDLNELRETVKRYKQDR